MSRFILYLPVALAILLGGPVQAAPAVSVEALFKNRALLRIGDQSVLLSVGESTAEGVTLLAADAMGARIQVDGEELDLVLNQTISTRAAVPPDLAEVDIWRDDAGFFRIPGTLNGVLATFLVDTGASHVALNEAHARRCGIDYRAAGEPTMVNTAGGMSEAYAVRIKELSIGGITQRNVAALVISGGHPTEILLGNSFLGNLEIRNQGDRMILKEKY